MNSAAAAANAKSKVVANLKTKKTRNVVSRRTNRTRKSQCQKDALWELYKELDGKTPARERIVELASELNLKVN